MITRQSSYNLGFFWKMINLWMNFDKTGHSVWFGGTYVRKSPIFRLATPDAYNIVPDQRKKERAHTIYIQQTSVQ